MKVARAYKNVRSSGRDFVVAIVWERRDRDGTCRREEPDWQSLLGDLAILIVKLWWRDDQNESECVLAIQVEPKETLLADEP